MNIITLISLWSIKILILLQPIIQQLVSRDALDFESISQLLILIYKNISNIKYIITLLAEMGEKEHIHYNNTTSNACTLTKNIFCISL